MGIAGGLDGELRLAHGCDETVSHISTLREKWGRTRQAEMLVLRGAEATQVKIVTKGERFL